MYLQCVRCNSNMHVWKPYRSYKGCDRAMATSLSYELSAMTGTPLQHEELRDKTNNLASSLAHRRYADIDWIRSAVQLRNDDINCRDIAGRPLLQVLLQVSWKGEENSLEDGTVYLIRLECKRHPSYINYLIQD